MFFLTKYGQREWLGCAFIAFLLAFVLIIFAITLGFWWLYLIAGFIIFIWLCIAAFFRDPVRDIPTDDNVLVAPADGHVSDIKMLEKTKYSDFFEDKPVIMIGVFLSVLDVHINRAPYPLTVSDIIYKKGKYLDARDKRASKENESNTLLCKAKGEKHNFPMAITQISGAIARRIVCPVKPKDEFFLGERFGMIKFGSRTELYLPADLPIELLVKEGDKIFAGSTIIAKVK